MTADNAFARVLSRSPALAAALYVLLTGALIVATCVACLDIVDRRRALNETSALLSQLQARKSGSMPNSLLATEHPGSPFLEGPTVTVAGAALLQRVAATVQNAGGTVQSSSVDVTGTQARDGFVALLVSCELEQAALQKVLYDLEAGMPFLYVDQLDVQAPQLATAMEGGTQRVRVVLGVSGQWQASP